jgi:hypothetical protein
MKTLKLLGIVLLSALFVLGMTACDEPVEDPVDLEGVLIIKTSSYGAYYTAKTLEASYDGDEEVDYTWYLGDTEKGIGKTYIPIEPGTYKVVVEAEGYNPLEKSVAVIQAPEYVNYLGKWKMDFSLPENKAWKDSPNGGEHNEYITITPTLYSLESDQQSKKKVNGVETGDAVNEYFTFTIEEWEAITTASAVDSAYIGGFKLSGEVTDEHGGYGKTLTNFSIYLKPDDPTLQVSDRGSDANAPKRYYKRMN